MRPERTRTKIFTRRAALLTGAKMAVFGGLVGRMYYLQVVEAERYRMLAEENRINFRLIPPPRGFIVDRNGDYLAINIQNYQAVLVPEQADDVVAVLTKLARVVDMEEHDVKRVLKEASRRRGFVPITVRENLTWEEVSRVGVNAPALPGVSIEVGQTRHYPYGRNMAHVVGYVGSVSEQELTGDPLLELPGFKIGKNGIEKRFDLALRGRSGTSQVEVNALGRVIKEIKRIEGQPGQDIRLTLDMRLQDVIGERIKDEQAAAVVVMDAHTGAVLGIASTPSYDPNAFSEGISNEDWQALVNNSRGPLTNKAIGGQYSPGSTFKVAVALAALENGMTEDHSVYCPGHMQLGNRRFHCWKKYGHGTMNLTDALRESCDVWFYDVARKIGVDKIAEMARRLGLGERHDIGLIGTKSGLIPTKKWKQDARGQPWHLGETLVVGIGQGYVLTTPLQLAVMTARIVNGGKAVKPHLAVNKFDGESMQARDPDSFPDLGISERHLAIVRDAMDEVVNHPRGTAGRAKINEENMQMGGKTGTSQVRRISKAERDSGIRKGEDIEWRLRDHALFVGFAPVHNPRFVTAVVVEHGGSGSAAAAPIAKDVLLEAQNLFKTETAASDPAADAPMDEARSPNPNGEAG
ncbi:MAG: penicillin-binding protein 2 [Alphaproteobacteria bacterium]